MKKLALLLAVTVTLAWFAGCTYREHRWTEATCTEPKTCADCGRRSGEPLGHDWAPASCTEPETCRRCGLTKGEPLGHDWAEASCAGPKTCARCGLTEGGPLGHAPTEADFWHPSVCAVCGAELGPALTPDFVACGLDDRLMEAGRTYDYVTRCLENHDARTTARLTVESCEITPGDGDRLEIADGYEWRAAVIRIVFDDDNARKWGMEIADCFENYYDIAGWDDSSRDREEDEGIFEVLWNGETWPIILRTEQDFLGWTDGAQTCVMTVLVHVPAGYDGFIVGFRDASAEWGEDQHISDVADENTLFFRLA